MKTILSFFKTTIVGGLLFLLPFVLTVILLHQAMHFVAKVLGPLAKALPFESVLGIKTPYIMSIVVLLLFGFFAGLLARTRLGTKIRAGFENFAIRRIPTYSLFKGAVDQIEGFQNRSDISVVLVKTGEGKWQLGFIVGKGVEGLLTVFVPSAPTPTSGAVSFVTEDNLRRVDMTVSAAVKCIMQIGVGSADLLKGPVKVAGVSKVESPNLGSKG